MNNFFPNKQISLLAFMLLFEVQSGFSQKIYTLSNCVQTAWTNNLQVKQNGLSIQGAQVNLEQTKMNRLPAFNASASHSYNTGRSINPFDNTVVQNKTVQSNSYGLSMNMNLFNGFQNQNTIERNKHNLTASKFDEQATKNTIALNTIESFLNVIVQKELLAVAKSQIQATTGQLERTQKLVLAGSLPKLNELELQSQLATEELNLVNTENQLALAKLTLLQNMQLPGNEEFDVQAPELKSENPLLEYNAPDQIYQVALPNQPQIKAGEARIKASEKNILVAKSNYLPSLSLNGGIFSNYSSVAQKVTPGRKLDSPIFTPTPFVVNQDINQIVYQVQTSSPSQISDFRYLEQIDNNLRRGVTFQLNIPIFNNYQVKAATSNADINRRVAELQLETTKNQLKQQIEQAYLSARASEKRFQTISKQIVALKESFRAAEQRFNAGLLNSAEFLISKNNLFRSESELIRTRYDLFLRTKVLDFYMGKQLEL